MDAARSVTAFAPASIGNVAVGFDMLGLAIAGVGDRVTATIGSQTGVSIAEVRGLDGEIHPWLSTDPAQNTASIAAAALWQAHGNGAGIELVVRKGVPLQSGMGGSAASAVAAVMAVNDLLDSPLSIRALLPFALRGEAYASGGDHADSRRKPRVDRAEKRGGRHRTADRDTGDLAAGVGAGVGPARPGHRHRPAVELAERIFEQPLDGDPRRLPLPSHVSGAIVRDGELEGGNRRSSSHGTRTGLDDRQAPRAEGAGVAGGGELVRWLDQLVAESPHTLNLRDRASELLP